MAETVWSDDHRVRRPALACTAAYVGWRFKQGHPDRDPIDDDQGQLVVLRCSLTGQDSPSWSSDRWEKALTQVAAGHLVKDAVDTWSTARSVTAWQGPHTSWGTVLDSVTQLGVVTQHALIADPVQALAGDLGLRPEPAELLGELAATFVPLPISQYLSYLRDGIRVICGVAGLLAANPALVAYAVHGFAKDALQELATEVVYQAAFGHQAPQVDVATLPDQTVQQEEAVVEAIPTRRKGRNNRQARLFQSAAAQVEWEASVNRLANTGHQSDGTSASC